MNLFKIPSKMRDRGLSLVSVLVALGITGILAVALNQVLVNSFKGSKSTELKSDVNALRHMILNATSCATTMPLGQCAAGSDVELLRKTSGGSQAIVKIGSGTELTRIGEYALRAQCNATGNGIKVRVARLKPGKAFNSNIDGDFYPDPMTGKISTWADDASQLFATGIEVCPNNGETPRRWTDVSASRTSTGLYVNNTGREIQVVISVYSGAAFKRCQAGIAVGGVNIDSNFVNNSVGAALCSAQATVPAGDSYQAKIEMMPAASAGENLIIKWMELR